MAIRTATPGTGFLDPRVLARIDSLELLARTVVDGFTNGLHRSPYLGLSLDFAEHRAYMPGDDIRRVDWRLYARTDRYYVKQFEADTNTNLLIALDISRSMRFAGASISKLDYARYLAACLAYFSNRQRDRVGLVTFTDDIVDYVPPAAGRLEVVLHTIDRIEPGAQGELAAPLLKVAEVSRRRGMLAVISDFYDEPERVLSAVRPLLGRGNDVMVFHILDPSELEFPFDSASTFEDLESGERIPVVPEHLREQYRELVRAHVTELARLFANDRIDYALFDTGTPLDHALFHYLASRERRSRAR